MKFGLKITEKCNMQCKHCMYSCTSSGLDMSKDVIDKSLLLYKTLKNANIHIIPFGIWGGEPFLNIEVFDYVYQTFKDDADSMYISSNGTWYFNKTIREYVLNFMLDIRQNKTYAEPYGIKISNTKWHIDARNKTQEESVKKLIEYSNHPENYLIDNPEWTKENPFRLAGCPELYVENEDYSDKRAYNYNPIGRALEYKTCNYGKQCDCIITTKELDDFLFEADFEVQPNGDIQLCCSANGCIIGTVFENLSYSEIINRISKIRKVLNLNPDTKMIDGCKKCSKINYHNINKKF